MTPIEILHDALLDGGLDAGQQADLRQRLADPAQRRAWRRLATFSGLLGEELAADGVARPAGAAQPIRHRVGPRPGPLLTAAAGALLAIGIGSWWARMGRAVEAPSAVVVTGGALRSEGGVHASGSVLPGTATLTGDGAGGLALEEGGTWAWSGSISLRREGPRRWALDHGDVRIALPSPGSPLALTTAFAAITTEPAARLRILSDSGLTRIGVEVGTVTVAAGAQRVALTPGQMLVATASGLAPASALTPPLSWRVTAGQSDWGGNAWLGKVDGTGVRPQPALDLPADDPRRFVEATVDDPPGMVGISPSAAVRVAVRSDRAGPMAIILVCKDCFTGEHLGNATAEVHLVGRGVLQDIAIPLSEFVGGSGWRLPQPGARETPAAIFSLLLQWWGDDLGSRVESIAIGR